MDKMNDRLIVIKEQIINDLPTELTIIFKALSNGESTMQLKGSILPFGNRNFQFGPEGELVGTDTVLSGCGIVEHNEEIENLYDED